MPNPGQVPRALLLSVGLISGAAIGFEILLTRLFALVHWHHMVATAIGLALLGYGASGTFVALADRYLDKYFTHVFITNAVLFSFSSLVCTSLAQTVGFDPQAVAWQPASVLALAGSFLILAVPFFAAANCVALALRRYGNDIPKIYGTDLLGAGAGALLITALLGWLHPEIALLTVALLGILVGVLAALQSRRRRVVVLSAAGLLSAGLVLHGPVEVEPAPYKDLARALTVTGAEVVFERSGVTGTVTVIDNRQVPRREAPGLSLGSMARTPPQLGVFKDGHAAGSIDRLDRDGTGTAYLDDLLSALPYRLLTRPSVAQLNAGLGRGVAQAWQLGAHSVLAIEPDPHLVDLVCGEFRSADRRRCPDRSTWRTGSARAFAVATERRFDLLVLNAQSDDAGLDALNVGFDLTVEAFRDYLALLNPHGLLMVEGPSRVPPRQSIRLLATAAAALEARGIATPGEHLALLRGWRRYLVLVFPEPVDAGRIDRIRELADNNGFDLAWLPGLTPSEVNRYQRLNRPLYYLAARQLLERNADIEGATLSLADRPANDDRPFPHRYSTRSSIRATLLDGQGGPARSEDGALLVGWLILMLAGLIATLLILVPLLVLRRLRDPDPSSVMPGKGYRAAVFAYFGLVGLAFLAIELTWIQVLELFLDQPLYATALVLAGFLIFAGLGSLWAQRQPPARTNRVLSSAVTAIVLVGGAYALWLSDLLVAVAPYPFPLKAAVALLLLAPLATAMGVPFSVGLRHVGEVAPRLIPWAWGINGCASVISAIGAPLIAIGIGFSGLLGAAILAYALTPFLLGSGTRQRP